MKFTIEKVKKLVIAHYDIEGDIKPLAGDVDYNFLVKDNQQNKYLLKICKPNVRKEDVDFQVELLNFINAKSLNFEVPSIILTASGTTTFIFHDGSVDCFARMHSWVEGKMLSEVNPRTDALLYSWGEICGQLSFALQKFDHPGAHRFEKWNPVESLYSRKYLEYIVSDPHKEIANYFWDLFEKEVLPVVADVRKSVNYSDAHEHNLLVNNDKINPGIKGVIDFGDAIYAPTICELAIACAYAGMYAPDPIASMSNVVAGYHAQFPLKENELSILFPLICGRLLITVASAAFSLHSAPDNEYHQISAQPAWDVLHLLRSEVPEFAHFSFRAACGFEPHPQNTDFRQWLNQNDKRIVSPIDLKGKKVVELDLSVGSLDLGGNANFETVPRFTRRVKEILFDNEADAGIGGWGEIRPFYTTDAYKVEGNNGPQWRTQHVGTDIWIEAETEVLAFFDGVVHAIQNNDNPCDYGPTVILKHKVTNDLCFYSLYGHLSLKTLTKCRIGQTVRAGEVIAWVGDENVNGGWPPHLHFQIILDLMGNVGDFPGVCYVSESKIWLSICPNLPEFPDHVHKETTGVSSILSQRQSVLGSSLSISYQKPLHMVRGAGIYLYEVSGRRYIDTVNNVAHVGHEHPRVVKAAQRQLELLNTNTRYLHDNIGRYAAALLSHCPKEMEVVYLVNSGSEANELAIRMAKVYSGQRDMIAIEAGYHGNTGACIDVSSYKFDGKGGSGAPEYTSIVNIPDRYRGAFKDTETAGRDYGLEVEKAIQQIQAKGRNVAGFIVESILSCGGQIVLPPNYLKTCFANVRAQGGLCISDEVQVGFGRVGSHFWGFELQDVVPDIITCGKPIGNGHPLAAVITTRAVADAFTNGMEFFNTFGGNPVSCAIGNEVLAVIKNEGLQENAKQIGSLLLKGLEQLKNKFDIIGDVRGVGLFLGFELVKNRDTLEPAAEEATYLVNRMRELGVLMSTDGPLHNVIKIKPPMCISENNALEILQRLEKVFSEDFLKR